MKSLQTMKDIHLQIKDTTIRVLIVRENPVQFIPNDEDTTKYHRHITFPHHLGVSTTRWDKGSGRDLVWQLDVA